MNPLLSRRNALRLAPGAALAVASAASAHGESDLAETPETAVRRAFACTSDGGLDVDARLALLMTNATVVCDDVPFPLDRRSYADHLRFLSENTATFATRFYDMRTALHGDTAVVSTFYNERSKPRGAGYRLRSGFCTVVCVREPGGWKAIALHMAPLSAQILDASPA